MNAKQKIVQGRGPSNTEILASLFAPLMFAGLQNQSPPSINYVLLQKKNGILASIF